MKFISAWSTYGTYNNGYFVIILAKNFRKLQSSIYLLLQLKWNLDEIIAWIYTNKMHN